jgi:multidrug resistance efflux pump
MIDEPSKPVQLTQEEEAKQQEAQARIERARADLAQAKRDRDRNQQLQCEPGNNSNLSNTWCAFVVESDRAEKRQIEVSQRSNFEAVIEKGLEPQEKVILHPTEQIQSGIKVKIR